MRITGGRARGIQLQLPARGEIRPATDYLREAVFSSLGALVGQACVLDVFAGTGAYGLEALSRGAGRAVFLEKNPAAVTAIRANIAGVGKSCGGVLPETKIIVGDALKQLPLAGDFFDLIFCDPPWELWKTEAPALLEKLAAQADGADARIILEAPGEFVPPVPVGWKIHRLLAKGKSQPAATILKKVES